VPGDAAKVNLINRVRGVYTSRQPVPAMAEYVLLTLSGAGLAKSDGGSAFRSSAG